MNLVAILNSQYLSALLMLEAPLQRCPATLWNDSQEKNRVWQVAYHVLFYTHLYLQPTEADFHPWVKARGEAQFFGAIPWDDSRLPIIAEPYTPAEIFEYLALVRGEVARLLPMLDFAGPSGFAWIPMTKLELHFYNIRHLQHHTGELYDRLGTRGQILDLPWVGQQADA